jgi:beta-lactamase regulating signal transducer with metallopeptidase domain
VENLFFECSVRAALIIGAAAIVLAVMKVKEPTAKHHIWTGVLALMLLLPIWTIGGPKASLRVLPPSPQASATQAKVLTEKLSPSVMLSTARNPEVALLLGMYLLGLCLLLLRLGIGTLRSRRLAREAVLREGLLTSSLCAAPVTVGFLHPKLILPEQWEQWPKAQLDAVLMHEAEHARRRHPLIQWFALFNRALFWFHPLAWWLEHHLSTLAEEACDSVVLAQGHDPGAYSEYLIDIARSVKGSGVRLNIAGLAMPGSSLARRIQRILESHSVPRISRPRMALVSLVCVISCTAIAVGTLDHAQPYSSAKHDATQQQAATTGQPTKFILGDVGIEGDVPDPNGVRDRVLNASNGREYENREEVSDKVARHTRADFQERGYFLAVIQIRSSLPLGLTDGKQSLRVVVSINPGDQFRLRNISIHSDAPDQTLSISAQTLREQFHLRDGDLFNTTEIGKGLERVHQLYVSRGYASATTIPETDIDRDSHRIDLILSIDEGPHTS